MNEHYKQTNRITAARQSCRASSPFISEYRKVTLVARSGAGVWAVGGKIIGTGRTLEITGEVGATETVTYTSDGIIYEHIISY